MTEKKLTPRVGDRVLVELDGEYSIGRVVKSAPGLPPKGSRVHNRANITVLGREPVEWPEGWRTHDSPHERAVLSVPGGYAHILSKIEIEKILADGPYIIEHWDELLGGDS